MVQWKSHWSMKVGFHHQRPLITPSKQLNVPFCFDGQGSSSAVWDAINTEIDPRFWHILL